MSTPFVLPQYQGSLYDLQRQQALANALMQNSLTPQQSPQGAPAGPYQVTGRVSPLAPLSQIGQALMSARLGQQASQGLNNLGQQQWGSLVSMLGGGAGGQSPQPNPGSGAVAGAGAGGDAAYGSDGGNGTSAAGGGGGSGQPLSGVPAGPGGLNGGIGGGGNSPLNPLGMNPGMAAMMMMESPDKYWEAQSAAYKPSDIVAQLRAAGIDPNSPLGRQVGQQALAKALYQAPTSIRGQTYADMNGIHTLPADAPEGFQKVQDANGNWGYAPVQNGTGAIQQAAAAGAIGKAYGNVIPGFVNGQPTYVNQGALAGQTAGGASPFGNSNGRYPSGAQGAAPGAGNVQPSLAPAESAAQTTMGDKSATQYSGELQAAGGFGTRMFNLNKALTGLQNAQTGPGSDSVNTVRSFLMAQGPQVLQSLGIVDPSKIQSYDEANKYLTQYAMNQAGALGEGTDAKLATTLSGNANTHISNLAAQDVVKANMALERMNQAAVNSFSQSGQSPAQYSAWKAQFASRVDPRVFAWDLMDKPKQQAMYNGMNDAQRNQFRTQYNWATQNGFLGQ